MNFSSPFQWIQFCWVAFGLYWLISAFNRKATKRRETYFQRLVYTLPLGIAGYLMFRPERASAGWVCASFPRDRPRNG